MSLFNRSLIIFCTLLSLVFLLVFYPTAHMIFYTMMLVGVLAMYQAYIILIDSTETVESRDDEA